MSKFFWLSEREHHVVDAKRNIVLTKAKSTVDAGSIGVPIAIGINAGQDDICRLKPIEEILDIL